MYLYIKNNTNLTSSQAKKFKNLIKVIQVLFPGLNEGEYFEVVYDKDGNKHYSFCSHFNLKTLKEFEKFLENCDGRVNLTICPAVRIPKDKLNSRTGNEHVSRIKSLILDIEDSNVHKGSGKVDPETVKGWIQKTLEELPAPFKSPFYTAYTGGGGQIAFIFDKWLEKQEAETFFKLFREYVFREKTEKGIFQYVDVGALKLSQPLRLITTFNVTRGTNSFFFEIADPTPFINVEQVFNFLGSYFLQKKTERVLKKLVEEEEREERGKKRRKINYREVIEEIKKKGSFKDVYHFDGLKEYGNYYTALCPLHNERHSSFVVYRNYDGELGIDYHTQKIYDVISFYEEIHGKTKKESIGELAEMAGIKLPKEEEKERKDRDKSKEEDEEEVEVNWKEIWELFKIEKIYTFKEEDEYVYEFVTRDEKRGEVVSFIVPVSLAFESIVKFAKKFVTAYVNATGDNGSLWETWEKVRHDRKVWELIYVHVRSIAEHTKERGMDYHVFNDFLEVVRDAEWTDDWKEFYSSRSAVKCVENENGTVTVYLKLKPLMNRIERFSAFKSKLSEKKVIELLRKVGAEPVLLSRGGKKVRVWKLPENEKWKWIQIEPEKTEPVQEPLVEVKESFEVKESKGNGNGSKEVQSQETEKWTKHVDSYELTEEEVKEEVEEDEDWFHNPKTETQRWYKQQWEEMEKLCGSLPPDEDVPF